MSRYHTLLNFVLFTALAANAAERIPAPSRPLVPAVQTPPSPTVPYVAPVPVTPGRTGAASASGTAAPVASRGLGCVAVSTPTFSQGAKNAAYHYIPLVTNNTSAALPAGTRIEWSIHGQTGPGMSGIHELITPLPAGKKVHVGKAPPIPNAPPLLRCEATAVP